MGRGGGGESARVAGGIGESGGRTRGMGEARQDEGKAGCMGEAGVRSAPSFPGEGSALFWVEVTILLVGKVRGPRDTGWERDKGYHEAGGLHSTLGVGGLLTAPKSNSMSSKSPSSNILAPRSLAISATMTGHHASLTRCR